MAEGLLRALGGPVVEVASAGTSPKPVHAQAVRAMREIGIDISGQQSKSVEPFLKESFDYVITLCDSAKQSCPVFPGPAKRLDWSLPDPAAAKGSAEKRLRAFRSVREQLAAHIDQLLAEILDGMLGRLAAQMDAYEATAPPPKYP
jgi:arsenate reductase (thioredoxin)